MKRSPLATLAALVLGLVVAVGATVPAASAAPHHDKHSSKSAHGKSAHAKSAKASKSERRLAREQRRVEARVERKDTRLAREAARVTRSGIAQADLVLANIAADQVALAELATAAQAATSRGEVRAVEAQVRDFRPSVYAAVRTGLRQLAHFESLAGEQVATQVATAVEQGVALTSLSTRKEKVAFRTAVAEVAAAVEALEPTETEPTETEPTETEPTETEPAV